MVSNRAVPINSAIKSEISGRWAVGGISLLRYNIRALFVWEKIKKEPDLRRPRLLFINFHL
jgi:hypothetical protein